MNRFSPHLVCFLLVSLLSVTLAEKPNILLIFADDIGYEALNCYGGLDFKTPHLNAMAESGVRFSRAYTSPVCTPSRVSLHTGLYVPRHGHTGVLPVHRGTTKKVDFQKMPTFAQLMRANGYATSVTGKWQLATLEAWPEHIRRAGFDSWCIWQIWRQGKKTLRHWNPTFNQDGKARDDIADRFGPDVLADYVIEQMAEAKKAGKPFLIVHNELLPHDPIIQTPNEKTSGGKASLGGMIRYMDQLVGRVLEAIESLGIRDNTYVLFMGDNGTHEKDFVNPRAGKPNEKNHTRHTRSGNVNGGKSKLGDAGTHVPLIVWGPGSVPQGKVCGDLIDVVDLFPTFCQLSGTDVPDSLAIDGRSIVPQIHGRTGIHRPWVHHAFGKNGENLFDGSWRLFRKNGQMRDARALPAEPLAAEDDPETASARKKLSNIFRKIERDGARPPEPFGAIAEKPRTEQPANSADDPNRADVIVYGDASGGVAAAVQAARMGKDVILISQYGHLGGLTSSGLGWTDIGHTSILGGISREFYHRVYMHYLLPSAWKYQDRASYGNRGQGAPAFDARTRLASVFEPRIAEKILDNLIAEAGVRMVKGRLDLKKGVTKKERRITAIHLEGSTTFEAAMFIDASYEGDLLAAAGVSFRMGREANSEFDEAGNGITGPRRGNQLPNGIDPYIRKGDPASGLLPGVNPDMGGKVGEADHRLQAYCYRMVLTDVETNRVPIEKPANYNEADYEILFRAIEAGQRGRFFKTSPVPNRKTDSNNASGISCDYIGMNYGKDWNWATLDHKEREALAARQRDWQLGLVWTLQHHPRVPETIRKSVSKWGLPRDEFPDNGHWPYNLYIREARRMISDFVMTEAHCRNQKPVEDSVGMGAYTLDSHNVQRFVHNGMVKNEGDIQSSIRATGPYSISYRSLIPRASECENLLVPWALSSTHIAFGSIRMEPVFMILGQSAGTAACLAIDDGISVQKVDYQKLRKRLEADGQVLNHRVSRKAAPKAMGRDPKKLPGIVIDDEDAERAGRWLLSNRKGESLGPSYHHDGAAKDGKCTATFTASLPQPGTYEVRISYTMFTNRATNVPVTITHKDGTKTVTINQRKRPPIEGLFISLGKFEFVKEGIVTIRNEGTNGHVIIDGAQWIPVR
ncbi:MAG: FAD-dependent oxidoreductase [Planctomycetota bacterium]|jgi:arylsulfatase A-like enzyme|nr:FAD-dependent oxidoreductase [Planctomycetota bacterium]